MRGGLQERIISVWSPYASKQRLLDEGREKAKGEEQMDLDALPRSRKPQPRHTERARFSLSHTPLLRTHTTLWPGALQTNESDTSGLFLLSILVCTQACDRQAGIMVYDETDRVPSS